MTKSQSLGPGLMIWVDVHQEQGYTDGKQCIRLIVISLVLILLHRIPADLTHKTSLGVRLIFSPKVILMDVGQPPSIRENTYIPDYTITSRKGSMVDHARLSTIKGGDLIENNDSQSDNVPLSRARG